MSEAFWQAFADRHLSPAPDQAMRWETEGCVARYVGEGDLPFQYSLYFFKASEDPTSEIVREVERAQRLGRSSEWIAYPRPESQAWLKDLSLQGFTLKRRDRMFYRASENLVSADPSLRVDRVLSEADVSELAQVLREVWNDPAPVVLNYLRNELMRGSNRSHAYLVRMQGRPVACGWIKYYGKIAYLFGGSTVREFRGQGCYPALVRARMLRAHEDGARFVVSDCSPSSERVLRRLDFIDGGDVLKYEKKI